MENRYKIITSASSYVDVEETAEYIETQLKNPSAADRFVENAQKTVFSLADMPDRRQLCQVETLKRQNRRFISFGNHLIFYSIAEDENTVFVDRVLYDRMNWHEFL